MDALKNHIELYRGPMDGATVPAAAVQHGTLRAGIMRRLARYSPDFRAQVWEFAPPEIMPEFVVTYKLEGGKLIYVTTEIPKNPTD